MIKKLLILFITTLCAVVLFSMKTFGQGSYIKYTLDGKEYSFVDEDASCYYKEGERYDEDKRDFMETVVYVSTFAKSSDKLNISIRTESNNKPKVDVYPFMSRLAHTKILPNVNISLDREVKEDYEFYGTNDRNPGKFEITKVEGDWIEGTFEVNLPNMYNEKAKPLKITAGSFRIKMRAWL